MVLRTRLHDRLTPCASRVLTRSYLTSFLLQLNPSAISSRPIVTLPFLCPTRHRHTRQRTIIQPSKACRTYATSTGSSDGTSRGVTSTTHTKSDEEITTSADSTSGSDISFDQQQSQPAGAPGQTHSASKIKLPDLLNLDESQWTPENRQMLWRAWMGLSEDHQSTRLQLLYSLLRMLQTHETSDAHKLQTLLDTKQDFLDKEARHFYTFWAHAILKEPDLAMTHFRKLPGRLHLSHWEFFMDKIIETGDWKTGVQLWQLVLHEAQWRGKESIRALLHLIPNVHTWQFLQVLNANDAQEMKDRIRFTLIMHLARIDHTKAAPLIADAIAHSSHISELAIASQMRALIKDGANLDALNLYHAVLESKIAPAATPNMSLAAIDAAAKMGDIETMRALVETGILDSLEDDDTGVRIILPYTTVMHAFATHGMVAEVDKVFDDFLSIGLKPDVVMLSALIRARVQTLQVSQARELFLSCKEKYGIEPDQIAHNILLDGFTNVLDLQSARKLISAMLEAGFQPDEFTASTYINLFARTKDSDGAELAYSEMLALGVKPNVTVYGALMHAYVEAGDSDRFSKASQDFADSGIEPNVWIMNILLKHFAKEGRSALDMQKLIESMQALGVSPDAVTKAQLMQAMLRERDTDKASELFNSLKSPTVYHYTIIMVCLLREQSKESHEALLYYYNQMLDRGIKPTFVTMAVLMNAFVLGDSPNSGRRLARLLDSLETWKDVDMSSRFVPRNVPSPDVYLPLMRRNKVGVVKIISPQAAYDKFLSSIADADSRPSIRVLTAMMAVYAAANRTEEVKALFQKAKKEADRRYRYQLEPLIAPESNSQVSDHENRNASNGFDAASGIQVGAKGISVSRGARFVLSEALRILVEHLAAVRAYSELDQVWQHLRREGYDFEVSLWNTLAQIKVRQGDVRTACQLVLDNLLVVDGTVYEKTKHQISQAFNLLKRRRSHSQRIDQDGAWSKLVHTYESLVAALQVYEANRTTEANEARARMEEDAADDGNESDRAIEA